MSAKQQPKARAKAPKAALAGSHFGRYWQINVEDVPAMVERMAKALYYNQWRRRWSTLTDSTQEGFRAQVRVQLLAIGIRVPRRALQRK